MKKQITVESAIERINYLSNLPKEQRAKELKHIDNIVENHKTPYYNKKIISPERKKKHKAIFHPNPKEITFRLNIRKQFNGRITIDIPKQYRNEFKNGQLVLFRIIIL